MGISLTKTQHDSLTKFLKDTKTVSAKDNKILDKTAIETFKSSFKQAGIDLNDTGNANTKAIREDMKMLSGLSPESLQDTGQSGPNKFTNTFWEGAMDDIIKQVDGASIVDAQGITNAAGNGSADGLLSDPASKIGKMNADLTAGGNITQTATGTYQKTLQDPSATAEQIGSAQRDVQLAFQLQYPDASVSQVKDYLKGSSDIIATGNAGRHQEVSASIEQTQMADDVSKKNKQAQDASQIPVGNNI